MARPSREALSTYSTLSTRYDASFSRDRPGSAPPYQTQARRSPSCSRTGLARAIVRTHRPSSARARAGRRQPVRRRRRQRSLLSPLACSAHSDHGLDHAEESTHRSSGRIDELSGTICTRPDECRSVGSTRAGRRCDGGRLLHQVRWHQR